MSNALKPPKPAIDWSYYMIMTLVFLGLLILLGLAIELPIWFFSR